MKTIDSNGAAPARAKIKVDGRRYAIYRRPDAAGRVSNDSPWYLRTTILGRLLHRALDTNVRAQAEVVAARLVRAARAEKWDAVDATRHKRACASLGDVVERYAPLWRVMGKKQRTWHANVTTLGRVLEVMGESRALAAVPVSVLTRKFATDFQARFVERVRDRDPLKRNGAAVTANSYLRMVRSLFSRRVMARGAYDGLGLPDLEPFLRAPELDELPPQYVRPRAEVLSALARASVSLRAERPAVWMVWWLAVQSGLRRGELLAMRWEWFGPGRIEVPCSAEFIAKGKRSRVVPVVPACEIDARAVASGLGWTVGALDRVLQGNTDRMFRDLGEWMVANGWERRQKAHELRKVFAQALAEGSGDIYAVKEALGHRDVKTTERYAAAAVARAVDVVATMGGR